MKVEEKEMEGIKYKIDRIYTGVLWSILEELKAYRKVHKEDRCTMLIHLN